jgi:hypothetical protein
LKEKFEKMALNTETQALKRIGENKSYNKQIDLIINMNKKIKLSHSLSQQGG